MYSSLLNKNIGKINKLIMFLEKHWNKSEVGASMIQGGDVLTLKFFKHIRVI